MSTDTSTMTEAQRDQAEARRIYRASCAAGDPITGTALAEQFNRKERWGQERIAEAKAEAKADGRAWSDQPLPGFEGRCYSPRHDAACGNRRDHSGRQRFPRGK